MNEPAIELDPPPHEWADRIAFDPARHAGERARFGLPTDRPVVMAGHQGHFWHAGIAAKLFAAQALADRVGGAVAWLVIDTDGTEPASLRVPIADDRGNLGERTLRLDRETTDLPRARAAARAYERHGGERSPALRATLATLDLLPTPTPILLRSSRLGETAAFGALVDGFRRDAAFARRSYNHAAASAPDAGIAELRGNEVPFWRLTPSGARLPARESDLDAPLWPRALATTGVARASLCDLFVHGVGGAAYEPINDRWLADALGWNLAPFVSATATLRLRFEGDAVSEAEAQAAVWRAHHARHHPGLLGVDRAQAERARLVAEIDRLPRGDARRAGLFGELHALLESVRRSHAGALSKLDAMADELVARAKERGVRDDRTWPAALHEPEDLAALRDAIASAFGPPVRRAGP